MAYAPETESRISWDPPGLKQGVTIERFISGRWYAWYLPFNGVATQAQAAEILGVSLMAVNNWVRDGKLHELHNVKPSLIPLHDIKRVKVILEQRGRLVGG